MRRRLFVAVIVAAFLLGAALPSSALAKAERQTITTAIRGVATSYTIPRLHAVGSGIAVSGRLVSTKLVWRHGRRVRVDTPINGAIVLYRINDETGQLIRVATTSTLNSAFSFDVVTGARYQVSFWGHGRFKKCRVRPTVLDDEASVGNFTGYRASLTPAGDVYVTVTADLGAPAGVLTSDTPGIAYLVSGSPGVAKGSTLLAATPFPTSDPTVYGITMQLIPKVGTYRFGFTVPSEKRYDKIELLLGFLPGEYVLPVTGTTSFVPNDLIP
jgi:hypothetical protein